MATFMQGEAPGNWHDAVDLFPPHVLAGIEHALCTINKRQHPGEPWSIETQRAQMVFRSHSKKQPDTVAFEYRAGLEKTAEGVPGWPYVEFEKQRRHVLWYWQNSRGRRFVIFPLVRWMMFAETFNGKVRDNKLVIGYPERIIVSLGTGVFGEVTVEKNEWNRRLATLFKIIPVSAMRDAGLILLEGYADGRKDWRIIERMPPLFRFWKRRR